MGIKSPEEYREDARLVRALAAQASEEDARYPLLGLADLLECLARRAETPRDRSHQTEQWQTPLSQSPSTPPP